MVLTRLALALAALSATACAPSLTIVSWEPGRIATVGARSLLLVEGDGQPGVGRIAAQLVVSEARGGWFRVEDRGREGVKLLLVGERAEVAFARQSLPEEALWVRVDVVQWQTTDTTVESEDDTGNVTPAPARRSDVALQITIADGTGRVLMRERQYLGTILVEEGAAPIADALQQAARAAAASFLADIAPKQVAQLVRLDDSDGGLDTALDNIRANRWTLAEAEQRLRRYLSKHSSNAIATYDLAVLVDAQGHHEDALPLYDDAMRIHTRDYYIEARAGCARRATARRSVFGERSNVTIEAGPLERGQLEAEPPPPLSPAVPGGSAPAGEAPPPG